MKRNVIFISLLFMTSIFLTACAKEYSLNDEKNDTKSIDITYKRIYDFNETGDELLSYYDVAIYNYLIGYDMNIQKNYYDDECENRYKESTES